MILLSLTHNIALLIALTMLHQLVLRRWTHGSTGYTVMSGLLFGIVGIVGMMTPFVLVPGLIFDTRTIMLAIAGLFGGPMVAGIAAVICGGFRIAIGGTGMVVGLMTILLATGMGIGMHYLRRIDARVMRVVPLWLFGMLVHLGMVLVMLLLPVRESADFMRQLALPVLGLYPIGTVLIARIFLLQEERMQTQHRLVESEDRYRSLFENHHAVMLLFDPLTGRVVDANPAATVYYGYTREHMRGMPVDEINTLPLDRIKDEMARAAARVQMHFTFQHRLATGEVRDVEVYSGPVHADGRTLLLSVVHDVTERKRMEAEMLAAREQAERADAMKDLFIATMSHEIRTPLNIILGYSDLMRELADPAGRHMTEQVTASIHNAGSRLMRTVDLILSYSNVSAGSYRPEFRSVDLRALVVDTARTYQTLAREKALRLFHHVDDELAPVVCDRYTVEQCICNLLDNAIKFTHDGSIMLSARRRDGHVIITVEDTGIGISDEYLPRLFDAFSQENGGYTRPYEGVGLGLSLVKLYADINAGSVHVESEKGRGSRFELWIPSHREIPESLGFGARSTP